MRFLDLVMWIAKGIPFEKINSSPTIHNSYLNRIHSGFTNSKFIYSGNPPALWCALISFFGSPLLNKPWFTWTQANWWAIALIKRATTTEEIHSSWKCKKNLLISYLFFNKSMARTAYSTKKKMHYKMNSY